MVGEIEPFALLVRVGIAPSGPLIPAAGVTATSPATAPDAPPSSDGLPDRHRSIPIQPRRASTR